MNIELTGRVALVTGGGKGIGRAIALEFAEAGAAVAVDAAHLTSAQNTADEIIKLGGKAIAIEADVAIENQVDNMIGQIIKEYGRIDIVVNNAGVGSELVSTIEQSIEKFDRLIAVHLRGTYLCSRAAARHMIKVKSGKIVNIASVTGMVGMPIRTSYGAAKAGIIQLTKTLAVEWAQYNINVNSISPGTVLTPMVEGHIKAGNIDVEPLKRRHPLGRLGKPEEIADAALFLASDHASWITGINLPVDGGWSAYGFI